MDADYVIVGGGSAGCVLARRLADSGASVILLEAGGPDKTRLVRKPGMIAIFHNVPQLKKRLDWGYYTVPQKHALDRKLPQPRGRVLGGSGSINGMLFVRGNRQNYDDWADAGCKGWSFADVLPSFKKMESWEGGENDYRGGAGPVRVTRRKELTPASQAFMESLAASAGVPVIDDYNGADQEGAAVFQENVDGGLRYSSSIGYLDNHGLPNLRVRTGVRATKILLENGRATGVEVAGGEIIRAGREVVLSAGVFGSAQLLMLSGIGPAAHLRDLGIDVLVDLPVGENLHDHMFVPMTYVMPTALNHGTARYFARGMLAEAIRGNTWLSRSVFEVAGFVRSSLAGAIPDIQIHALPWSYPSPNQDSPKRQKVDPRCALTIFSTLIYPKSRGTLRLTSADPSDAPAIDFGYLSEPDDATVLLDGMELIRDVMSDKRIAGQVKLELSPGKGFSRSRGAGARAAQPRDLGVSRGRELPDGQRRAGGRGSGVAGAGRGRPAGGRRVDHADRHRREHQRPRDDDRREGWLAYPPGGSPPDPPSRAAPGGAWRRSADLTVGALIPSKISRRSASDTCWGVYPRRHWAGIHRTSRSRR